MTKGANLSLMVKGKPMKCKCGKKLVNYRCESCKLIATWYNGKEVFSFMRIQDYEAARENLQDQLDEAFENQYFNLNEEGW